jgi:hypothetical protein
MSNRTDWARLSEEIANDLFDGGTTKSAYAAMQSRIEAELHNAFVAGQESADCSAREVEFIGVSGHDLAKHVVYADWAKEADRALGKGLVVVLCPSSGA